MTFVPTVRPSVHLCLSVLLSKYLYIYMSVRLAGRPSSEILEVR